MVLKGRRSPSIDGAIFTGEEAGSAMTAPGATVPAGSAMLRRRFAAALQHHQAGRLAQAEQLYRQILAIEPRHDESLHLLGVVFCQCGRADLAAPLIERAIALRGGVAAYHYNLGLALQMQGRLEAAGRGFEQAVALKPDYVEAHNNLAVVALQQGRLEAAAAGFERVLGLQPGHAQAGCNLAVALQQQGRLDAAIARFEQVLGQHPNYPDAWYNLGLARERRSRGAEAIPAFERALELRPDYPEALHSLAAALQARARLDEAASCWERAVASRPDHAESWYGLGSTRHQQGRIDEASTCYDRAIEIRADFPDPLSNLALILKDRGEVAAALGLLDRALALQPDFPAARLNQAMLRLLTGDFRAGWRQYEARWQTPQLDPDRRDVAVPRWDGAFGNGRTILVWAEQGLGDSLQFCRYVPLLAERGWRVLVEVPQSLVRLFGSLAGATVLPIGGAAGLSIDCHCPMMSLPLLFATELATIPAMIPYLAAPASERADRPPAEGARTLRVGLVWAGNPGTLSALHQAVDTRRSIPLARLAPLLAVPGVRFVSLQKDRRPGEEPAARGLLDPMGSVEDFADTAAIVAGLDLVIAVDTAIVHLAGALGRPVWLLNRFDTCWRWLQDRGDSPWYPTLRQFRQPAPGDWDSVIAAATAALTVLAADRQRAAEP
jgi:tetratricopeptide (TPR) repeat protein